MNLAVRISGQDDGATALIGKVDNGLGGLGGVAKTAGLAVAGVGLAAGAAAAGGIAAAVSAAAGFEEQLSGIKAVSGATQKEMGDLSGLALKLGKDTSFSASEAAAGIEELVKGGLTIPDIMNGAAEATLNLAAAGGVDLADAATISANALAQFNLKGSDMSHVADLIAGAANASALDVGQFAQSLQASGAVAATVGFSFDDLAEGIAIMGKAGITGSDAGTSLKTMMLNLSPTTDKAATAMQELGIMSFNSEEAMRRLQANGIVPAAAGSSELYNQTLRLTLGMKENQGITAQNMKDFSKMSQEVGLTSNAFFDASGKVKSMSEVAEVLQKSTANLTQEQKLSTLQTLFGSDAIRAAAVLAKEGAAGFDEMAGSMGKVTAATVGAEKLNNFNGSIQQLQGSVETAGITLGMAFLPVLKQLADGATNVVNQMIPFLEVAGPKLVEMVGQGIDFLKSIDLSPFMHLWEMAQDIMGDFADVVQQALAGDVTGAIGGLLDVVTDTRGRLVELLAGWGQAFIEWILPMVPGLLDNLAKFSQEIAGKIAQFAAEYVEQLATWGAAFVDWIAPKIPDLLRELGNFSAKMLGWLIGDALPAILLKLGEWGLAFVEWVAPRIPPLLVELSKLLAQLTMWVITTALPAIIGKLVEWGAAFVDWVADVVLPKLPGALAAIGTAITTWISGAVASMKTEAGRIGTAIIDGVKAGIANAAGSLNAAMQNMATGALNAAKATLGISSPSKAFADEVGEPIVDGIIDGIDASWSRLETHLDNKMSDLVDQATDGARAISGAISSGISGGGGGGGSEGPNTDGQSAPSQFQSDPLYQQIAQNKNWSGNVPGILSMDFGNGISYNAEADTYRGSEKPHPGKSGYYSVWYRINSLLSAGHYSNVNDAFAAAVQWVFDRTDDRYDAQLGWTLGAPTGGGAGANYSGMSLEALNAAWGAAGFPDSGPIWDEIVRRRPKQYGGAMAKGGPVWAGMSYTVGERGPETLVMGGRSGRIIPNGGSIDYERLALALAQQPITVTLNGEAVGRLVRDELARLSRRNSGLGLAGA